MHKKVHKVEPYELYRLYKLYKPYELYKLFLPASFSVFVFQFANFQSGHSLSQVL